MKSDDPSDAVRQIVAWADAYSEGTIEPLSDEEMERASEALAKGRRQHRSPPRPLGSHPGGGHREAGKRGAGAAEGRRVTH